MLLLMQFGFHSAFILKSFSHIISLLSDVIQSLSEVALSHMQHITVVCPHHTLSLLLVLCLVQSPGGTCSLKILQDIYLLLVSLDISKTCKLFTVQLFYIYENRLTNLDWCK